MKDPRIAQITALLRDVPDFPKPGILFRDIAPVLASHEAFEAALAIFEERFRDSKVDYIVGIESRGFIFGAALALKMKVGFVPVRKSGKLPPPVDRVEYALEYGTDALEIQHGAMAKGARVLLVDDVLATGGTARAAIGLLERQGMHVVSTAFLIALVALGGAQKLEPTACFSVLEL